MPRWGWFFDYSVSCLDVQIPDYICFLDLRKRVPEEGMQCKSPFTLLTLC